VRGPAARTESRGVVDRRARRRADPEVPSLLRAPRGGRSCPRSATAFRPCREGRVKFTRLWSRRSRPLRSSERCPAKMASPRQRRIGALAAPATGASGRAGNRCRDRSPSRSCSATDVSSDPTLSWSSTANPTIRAAGTTHSRRSSTPSIWTAAVPSAVSSSPRRDRPDWSNPAPCAASGTAGRSSRNPAGSTTSSQGSPPRPASTWIICPVRRPTPPAQVPFDDARPRRRGTSPRQVVSCASKEVGEPREVVIQLGRRRLELLRVGDLAQVSNRPGARSATSRPWVSNASYLVEDLLDSRSVQATDERATLVEDHQTSARDRVSDLDALPGDQLTQHRRADPEHACESRLADPVVLNDAVDEAPQRSAIEILLTLSSHCPTGRWCRDDDVDHVSILADGLMILWGNDLTRRTDSPVLYRKSRSWKRPGGERRSPRAWHDRIPLS
jgi:hypothetical protein